MDKSLPAADATIGDIAEHFGVSRRTVQRWLRDTDIPHRRIQGTVRFALPEVDGWAASDPSDQEEPCSSQEQDRASTGATPSAGSRE